MGSRVCCRCKIEQPMSEYGPQKKGPNGYRSQCRSCRRLEAKEYRKRNLDKVKAAKEAWKAKNPDYDKNYRENNPDKKRNASLKWYAKNKEVAKERAKTWNRNNPEKINAKQRRYMKNNPHIQSWRSVLRNSLSRLNKKKEGHTIDLLGYSAEDLKKHLESLFTDGMSWDNYGEWHIDHIKPVVNFDPKTPQSIVNALSNLRPMWATTREINGVIYEGNLNRPKYENLD
jgi:hypothetical protein